ncbi:Imm51 family immunity protein [Psychromonas antarctica]|jgi:hypothetical protein|uniref:Imm51 family immunity protein n=1 Tax=Psychromonas antarctica TaxID=67573 RepID=UPI001EE94405|nr:Imm51 family immunity protein [Psychromonas antarctica]MCG6201868.1 immunity 51 family protein [Psychromonas antarctica]
MKHANAYQPFLLSSFKKDHSLTLSDLKWSAFEQHDFLGDGEDWTMLIENLLTEKNPELLAKITFGDETMMFCIHSEDKDALHEIAEMVFSFYEDKTLLDAYITRYAQYEFEPNVAS